MDFVGRYILDVRLESAPPSHLKDFEAWPCEKCGKLYVDSGDGRSHEAEQLPNGALS
jgi:hypothetical protein